MGPLLAMLKESATAGLISGNGEAPEGMEEGEEPVFTHAEETKRLLRKEERRQKRAEDFKSAKESCAFNISFIRVFYRFTHTDVASLVIQTNLPRIQRP